MGPSEVVTAFDNGSIEIKTIDDTQNSFVVNGHRIRLYHQPISKQDFVDNALQQKEMEMVEEEVIRPSHNLGYLHLYICKYIFVSSNK